jgi:hypothetical protein
MDKEAYLYTPFYCEENIWHLSQVPSFSASDSKVVFVSNEKRSCPLWKQRAGVGEEEFVLWDYHVIFLHKQNSWQVFDLDTTLGLPVLFQTYVNATFRMSDRGLDEYAPKFRVIDAKEFVSLFSSDRSHMRNSDGTWKATPPTWPLIEGTGEPNLMQLADMSNPLTGKVMSFGDFFRAFRDEIK